MRTKGKSKLLVACVCGLIGQMCFAKYIEDIALQVDGFEIPIVVVTPDVGDGPFPVVYHVHGGGWNGGTATEVPEASLPTGYRFLSEEMGVIHVGLAYRCKAQGDFTDAVDDLRASIKWFEERAGQFNADLARVGLSGGSAGTPLSSLLAQDISGCKTYVGFYGVYDLLNNEESLFPNEEACKDYGLSETAEKRAASAYHNLADNPPAALLFHGAKDILTHPTQSLRYAGRLQSAGAFAEAIIYPDVNHGFFSQRYPKQYKDSVLRIAQLYAERLKAENYNRAKLENRLDQILVSYLPASKIDPGTLIGEWKSKSESFVFADDSTGYWVSGLNEKKPFAYELVPGVVELAIEGKKMALYLQNDGRFLYKVVDDSERRNGQRFHYKKL